MPEVLTISNTSPLLYLHLINRPARRIASLNKLSLTGAVGLVLKTKQASILPHIKPFIADLRQVGLWLDNALVELILAEAGE